MGAVAVALVLFAAPLAIMVRAAFFTQERGELERAALGVALRVGPQFASGDQVELPATAADNPVGVYDLKMRLRAGRDPAQPTWSREVRPPRHNALPTVT